MGCLFAPDPPGVTSSLEELFQAQGDRGREVVGQGRLLLPPEQGAESLLESPKLPHPGQDEVVIV
jgi:hypothetical protein